MAPLPETFLSSAAQPPKSPTRKNLMVEKRRAAWALSSGVTGRMPISAKAVGAARPAGRADLTRGTSSGRSGLLSPEIR